MVSRAVGSIDGDAAGTGENVIHTGLMPKRNALATVQSAKKPDGVAAQDNVNESICICA